MKWEEFQLTMLLICSTVLSTACLSAASKPANMELESAAGGESQGMSELTTEPLAEVIGFEQTASGILIRVITTGCTRSEDLKPVIKRLDADRVQLTVLRLKTDDCRRMPASKSVDYSLESLGLKDEEVILMNPLVAMPGRG